MKTFYNRAKTGMISVLFALFLIGTGDTVLATNYYSKASGNLQLVGTWGNATNGTGTSPASFTLGDIFTIQNRATATIGAAWTVSGVGSTVVVGDGTNACNFTVPANFAFVGNIDVSANGTLTLKNSTIPTLGNLNATSNVNYQGSVAQDIQPTTYGNLTSSGSGTRTLNGIFSITSSFTPGSSNQYTAISGTFEFSGTSNFNISAPTPQLPLTINFDKLKVSTTGAPCTMASVAITVNDYEQTNGTVRMTNSNIAKTFTVNNNFTLSNSSVFNLIATGSPTTASVSVGNLTKIQDNSSINLEIASNTGDGIFQTKDFEATSTNSSMINFGTGTISGNKFGISGNFTKSGTGKFSTSATTPAKGFEFNGTGTQTLSYSGNSSSKTQYVVKSGSTLQLLSDLTLGTATTPRSTFIVEGSLDADAYQIIAGNTTDPQFILSSGGTLKTKKTAGVYNASGAVSGFGAGNYTFDNASNYEFNGSSTQTPNFSNSTMNNLAVDNSGGVNLNASTTVNGTLTLTSGRLTLGTNNLIFGSSAAAVAGSFSASNMIVTDNTGTVRKIFSGAGSFDFPVGEVTGTAEYSPSSVTVNSISPAGSYISVKVTNAKQPNIVAATPDYLNRYWPITSDAATISADITCNYLTADISGTEANLVSAKRNGVWTKFSPVNTLTHVATYNGVNSFSDFTAVTNPEVSISTVPVVPAICNGQSIALTANATGTATLSYAWNIGIAGNVSSGSVSPGSNTTYTVTVTDGNGLSAVGSVNVIVNPVPIALVLTGSTICTSPGGNGTITSTTSATGVNYQLYNNLNVTVQVAQAGTGTGLTWSSLSAGTGYYVVATDGNSCVSPGSNAVDVSTTINPIALVLTGSTICTSPGGN
ncbi:MAG: hypothetical protein ABI763_06560, partial [Bacteroidota bacterium]